MAATASELANSSRTALPSADASSRAMPAAVTRSRRDSPDPFSSTSPGIATRFSLSHFCTTSAASAGVAGGGCFAVASVRKICRAITLFESLFTSRTMS